MSETTNNEEFDEDYPPPEASRVAQRAYVLLTLATRAWIEMEATRTDVEPANPIRASEKLTELIAWQEALGIASEMEPQEVALLHIPPGRLSPQQAINASWGIESATVLAWALQLFELPAYDEMVSLPDIADALRFREPSAMELLNAPVLRPLSELETFRQRMFTLHWRLRDFGLKLGAMDFADFVRTAWFGPLNAEGLRFKDNDLALQEYAINDAPEDLWQLCSSLAEERHRAANWLCGYQKLYSEVTTDT